MEIILKYFSDFTETQLHQFQSLDHLYREWNSRINVISRKDMDGLYEKHVLHSLSIAAVFDFEKSSRVIDIGTGGGFPGIPLAIYFPDVNFHLVDSVGKKLKVVEAIAREINLNNITTGHMRAEDFRDKNFDFAVSRAVAPLADLWKWSKPLISTKDEVRSTMFKRGLICLKGGDLHVEIQQSGTHPRIIEIYQLFPEEYFKEKYILYIPR
jgi:16S rRNA (guanine527-N7)-methyltransferase